MTSSGMSPAFFRTSSCRVHWPPQQSPKSSGHSLSTANAPSDAAPNRLARTNTRTSLCGILAFSNVTVCSKLACDSRGSSASVNTRASLGTSMIGSAPTRSCVVWSTIVRGLSSRTPCVRTCKKQAISDTFDTRTSRATCSCTTTSPTSSTISRSRPLLLDSSAFIHSMTSSGSHARIDTGIVTCWCLSPRTISIGRAHSACRSAASVELRISRT